MKQLIKVAVSPFYGRDSWVDESTGITFEKDERGLRVYKILEGTDLTGIRKAIRINALMLIEGELPQEEAVVEEPVVEAPKEEPKIEEPVVEISEVEEPEKEVKAKKTKSTKKAK